MIGLKHVKTTRVIKRKSQNGLDLIKKENQMDCDQNHKCIFESLEIKKVIKMLGSKPQMLKRMIEPTNDNFKQ